ncbi:MAG: ABC transporter permease [Christensenellales bacterium]|jgi:ribose transport system permease protein
MSNIKVSAKDKGDNIYRIRTMVLIAALLALVIAQIIKTPAIINSGMTAYGYLVKIVLSVASVAFIAAGVTFVIVTGNNDLSTSSTLMLTVIISCTLTQQYYETLGPNGASIMALTIPIIVGLLCGLVNGVLVGILRLNSFVATLGTQYAIQGVNLLYNGGLTAAAKDGLQLFSFVGRGNILGFSFPILLLLFCFLVLGFILHKTVFGRKIFAVGGNAEAARFSGINSQKIVMTAYIIAGVMSGVAGVFLASYTQTGDMLLGAGKEFNAIIAVVLGGAVMTGGSGRMSGTLLGALFLGTLDMFYIQFGITYMWQWVIRGALMLLVIYVNERLESAKGRSKS